MNLKGWFVLVVIVWSCGLCAQEHKRLWTLGFAYGVGEELNNSDYSFTNQFYKVHLGYALKRARFVSYELVVQPEINFGKHQLLNRYFVKPETPDYELYREKYTKLKNVNDYILNIGICVRTSVWDQLSVYASGSIGPMITDTETERLSEGFAFCDVIALGVSVRIGKLYFDVRPSLRHVSNAGFQGVNSGYNTKNIEFQVSFAL